MFNRITVLSRKWFVSSYIVLNLTFFNIFIILLILDKYISVYPMLRNFIFNSATLRFSIIVQDKPKHWHEIRIHGRGIVWLWKLTLDLPGCLKKRSATAFSSPRYPRTFAWYYCEMTKRMKYRIAISAIKGRSIMTTLIIAHRVKPNVKRGPRIRPRMYSYSYRQPAVDTSIVTSRTILPSRLSSRNFSVRIKHFRSCRWTK